MPLLYPANAKSIARLSPFQRLIKIGRHAPTRNRDSICHGFKPSEHEEVLLQTVATSTRHQVQEVDDESLRLQWLSVSCERCSKDVQQHAALESVDDSEKMRRAKVALRLDELLEDKGRLLDFAYTDENIESLRKQMQPAGSDGLLDSLSPTSQLSPLPDATPSPHPATRAVSNGSVPQSSTPLSHGFHRKRKLRDSPHSRSHSRDREASVATMSRLSSPDMTSASSRAASRQPSQAPEPVTQPESKRRRVGNHAETPQHDDLADAKPETDLDGTADTNVKQEIIADIEEEQDPAPKSAASTAEEGIPPRKERPAVIEERTGLIQFRAVTNDDDPESMILLTGLKNIFQRQLPKMPREYISRLVFDRNHQSVAIVKRGLQVVGGITYRPFKQRTFAEIVFCAITSTEQVKGYGSHLMNHLKDHVKASSPIMHFLTYADNYAIGYFKKQGFTKEINLDRAIWVGYIKDYEGGTLMQCSMVPRVKYLEVSDLLTAQKQAVLAKIRSMSRSHVVHPGLAVMRDRERIIKMKGLIENPDGTVARPERTGKREPSHSDDNLTATFLVDPSEVPGLKESGWTPEMDELSRRPKRGPHFAVMRHILVELNGHGSAWPFVNPVNGEEVTDYYDVIKNPMDLSTMEAKLENNQYANVDELVADAQLIFDNCRAYNPASSPYAKSATKLEKYLHDTLLPKVQSSL